MNCENKDIIIFNYSDAIFQLNDKGEAISLIKLKENAPILRLKNKVLIIPLSGKCTGLFEHKNKYGL